MCISCLIPNPAIREANGLYIQTKTSVSLSWCKDIAKMCH